MIIGTSGAIHAGKDSVGEYLAKTRGFKLIRFSDPIVDEALEYLRPTLEEYARERYSWPAETPVLDDILRVLLVHRRTDVTRRLLQDLGTMRRKQQADYWLLRMDTMLDLLTCAGNSVVIAGVRYENEIDLIKARGGLVVKLQRPSVEQNAMMNHVVEHGLDHFTAWDHVFENLGTLDELDAKIEAWISQVEKWNPTLTPFTAPILWVDSSTQV